MPCARIFYTSTLRSVIYSRAKYFPLSVPDSLWRRFPVLDDETSPVAWVNVPITGAESVFWPNVDSNQIKWSSVSMDIPWMSHWNSVVKTFTNSYISNSTKDSLYRDTTVLKFVGLILSIESIRLKIIVGRVVSNFLAFRYIISRSTDFGKDVHDKLVDTNIAIAWHKHIDYENITETSGTEYHFLFRLGWCIVFPQLVIALAFSSRTRSEFIWIHVIIGTYLISERSNR